MTDTIYQLVVDGRPITGTREEMEEEAGRTLTRGIAVLPPCECGSGEPCELCGLLAEN